MAYEHHVNPITLPVATTGVCQYRFVAMSTSVNGVTWPPAGGLGVIGAAASTMTSATTQAYLQNRAGMIAGVGSVVKIASTASSLSVGDRISCTSRGRAKALAAGNNELGTIIAGSSGTARFLTVLVTLAGTT